MTKEGGKRTIVLTMSPSTNDIWRPSYGTGRYFARTKEYVCWRESALMETMVYTAGQKPLVGPVKVTITAFFKDQRRDIDSPLKPALDVLQGYAYVNDRQVKVVVVVHQIDKKNPRLEVVVEEMGNEREEECL